MNYFIPVSGKDSSVTLAAGYQLRSYISGINQVVPASLVPGAFNGGVIAIETANPIQSNLNLNGFYGSISLAL